MAGNFEIHYFSKDELFLKSKTSSNPSHVYLDPTTIQYNAVFFALPGTTSHRESFYGTESSTRSEKFPVQWGNGELNRGGGSRQSKKLSMRNIDKPSTVGRNGCLSSLSLILSLQKFFLNDWPIAWPCSSVELGGVLELWGPLFHFGSKLIRMN